MSGPTWTDVVTAIATAVGAIAAIGAVVFAALPYRRELARRVREQAGHVSVWNGPSPVEATVRNTSAEAVYDVRVAFFTDEGAHIADGVDELPVLPPQDTLSIPATDSQSLNIYYMAEGQAPMIEVTFTDRDGRRWAKRTDGTLIPSS